ncbi:MAG: hypothetical protein MUO50_09665 [Longimicrobiales bacterium]|nr:hypothetical protein [Longimicrobiales bacterium]
MKKVRPLLTIALLGFLPLAACQEAGLTEPMVQELSLEDQLTLELLGDPTSSEAALELVGIQNSAAQRRGWRWGQTEGHSMQASQAELCFRNAEEAFAMGDQVRALEQARKGRRLVAQAIEMAGGSNAILGMVERLEALPLSVTTDPDAFVNSGKLGLQLGKLATTARKAIRAGDRTRAGALGVLSEQAFRHNRRQQNLVGAERAELAVALGAEAVELAKRLLGEQDGGADTEQAGLLATAEEFLAQSQRALEAGEDVPAAHLAHQAQWWALKAVVLPGGITDEEAPSILGLATTLLDQAGMAVGTDPTALQTALLTKATRMLESGKANVGNGVCRGLGALWQSAVISSYLIG